MNDEPPSTSPSSSKVQERSWLERIIHSFSSEPKSREELLAILKDAADNKVLDQEALDIMERTLDVSGQQVREVMIPRSQMICIKYDDKPADFLPTIIESSHSRFPVIGDSQDDIHGILLAKDLLPLILKGCEDFSLDQVIRPANIVPESKRLNVLLREFREKRYHMALVIDEYGGISGVVTIEDILEEIVGDIEDETDEDEDDAYIRKVSDQDHVVKALTPIEDFNSHFKTQFSDNEYDTIGGLVMHAFGHLPQRNETTELEGLQFRVLYSDNRQIHLLRVSAPAV